MLKALFGNPTIERILLFLVRHEEACPGTVSRDFQIPLNMVQKQLARLECGGILISTRNGKKRSYRWNIQHPLFKPIHHLLVLALRHSTQDAAHGRYLTPGERLSLAESLTHQAETLNPHKRYAPFTVTFKRFDDYEKWRKKQKNPWLV